MLEHPTLSLAAVALRKQIDDHTEIDAANVLFGHPAHVTPGDGVQAVSVYFFRVHAAGNTGAVTPEMPLDTVAHCLITPLGSTTSASSAAGNDLSGGENDLKILGQIMHCMHRYPRMRVNDQTPTAICDVEIAPLELTVDELSKIVPTAPAKGGFRPSVAYALALLPLRDKTPQPGGKPVRTVTYGVDVRERLDPERAVPVRDLNAIVAPDGEAIDPGRAAGPLEPPSAETLLLRDKLPHIQLVDGMGRTAYFKRIVTDKSKETLNLKISVKDASTGDKVKVTQKRWNPAAKDYTTVKQAEPALSADGGSWQVTLNWELETKAAGQHLLQVERQIDGAQREGNLCVVVVGPRSGP